MIDEDTRDKSDRQPVSSTDVPSETPSAAEGEPAPKPSDKDEGQNQGDFIEYLNEHFCGFNGG